MRLGLTGLGEQRQTVKAHK